MIKIDKNVELRGHESYGRSEMRYPWKEMEIGDSFLVPLEPGQDLRNQAQKMSAQANVAGLRFGRKFITRKREDENGIRVWRRF